MPSVDIEGIGTVEFDDGMSQEDISSAIEKDIIPRHQKGIDLRSQLASARSEVGPMLNRAGLAVSEFPAKALRAVDEFSEPWKQADAQPIMPRSYIGPMSEQFGLPPAAAGPPIEVPDTPETPALQDVIGRQQLLEHIQQQQHPVETAARQTAINLAETSRKPSGAAMLGATAVAPEAMAPVWLTMGAEGARDAVGQIKEAREEGDREKYYEGVLNLGVNLAMSTGGGKGTLDLARRVRGIPSPSPTEVPDASTITSAKSVPQPEVRAPVDEATPLRQQGEAAAPQEEVAKAPAQDVLGTLKPEAAKWEQQAKEALTGGLTQKAYDAGLAIENEAELASNREALAKLTKDRNEALERGDVDTGMRAGMQEQFLNEAHQAATGTKSGGQRQFELDPEYKPKFPQGEETLKAWRDAMVERKKQGQQVPASEPDFGKPEEAKPTEGKAPPVEELPSLKVGNKTKRVFKVKESFYNPDDEGTYKPGDKIYDTQLIRAGFKLPEAKAVESAKVEPAAAPAAAKVEAEVAKVARTQDRPTDIIDNITGNYGKIRGKKFSKPGAAGYYGEAYKAAAKQRPEIFSEKGQSPDEIVDSLRRDNLVGPNFTVDNLWDAIDRAHKQRTAISKRQTSEAKSERFEKALDKNEQKLSTLGLSVGDLSVGDTFSVQGEKFVVKAIDPDTGEVTLDDGRKFGTQTVPDGADIFADSGSVKMKPESAQFLPAGVKLEPPTPATPAPAVPKLRSMEKGTGELFQGPGESFKLVGEKGVDTERQAAEKAKAEQTKREAEEIAAKKQLGMFGSAGPGAKAAGEPPYSAIQQLTDQLNGAAPAGAAERLKAGEKIAEQWSQGKSLVDRATARMRNITETLKATARGVREVTDLDRAVAELDATLQQSSGESTNAKKALQRQMPNEFDRSAAAMSIEPASSPEILKEALKILPERTSAKVRRMLERAANPTPEMRQYAESLKQFFGIREQDAMQADLFQDGIRDYYTHVWGKEENMPDSLRGAFNSGRVSTYFQFARQRKIPTILEGIMEGKTPILDPAEVVPFYNYAMDKAIAGRGFVKQMTELDEPDGRPMTIIAGEGKRIEAGERVDAAILIKPKLKPEEFGDYKAVKHPAMQGWKWASKTEDGTPVFLKGDLLVHPNSYERIARMMDRDRLAPGPKTRAALRIGGEVKGMKLGGLPSLFHPLHLATHGLAHWTNVFKTEPIQWDAPATRFALEKGHLKLAPNPGELNIFAEGKAATGLAQKIPILGRWNKAYSHLLFEDLIPRWKLKTFENAYARAQWMKKNLGFFKGLTDEQIAARTGDSVNNAYGELNHLFLGKMGRDPRVQRGLSLALLAPDFGEARLRFVEKIFTRYGHEERIAALTLAATLYTAARVANYLSHGNAESDDLKNAFRVKVGKHWWTMRSVLGDAVHAYDEPGQFTYVRLSPLYSRTASDFLWGRDPRSGRKLTRMDKVENIAKQLVPIPLSGLTQEDRTFMEGFLQSMGVSNIRDTPVMDVQKLATQWRQSKGLDAGSEFIPSEGPSYWKLRTAINLGRTDHAASILADLRKTHSDAQIAQAMNTWARHPYTGSMQHEAQFLGTLTPPQHQLYQKARSEQMATLQDFYRLMAAHPGQRRTAQQPNRDLEILRSMAR